LSGHEFILGDPKGALDVQKELNPYEDHPEDVEDEEEVPEDEVLEKEAYMTKDYYMPGYVDPTPPKEYPPHIAQFKDYISSIGDFKKHGYEDEDYSPNTDFAPDASGFGPDTS